jgi:hypothetical protein
LAKRGVPIFPVRPKRKEPATQNGVLDATTDLARIEAWWEAMPEANIGIATGRASNLLVLDVDRHGGRDGDAALAALEARHGALPPTVTVATGCGRHLYFRIGAYAVQNSTGKLGEGLDIRADGGYVLAPPSRHPSGQSYAWIGAQEVAAAPPWLVKRLLPKANGKGRPPGYWSRLLSQPIPVGQRNDALASIAGKLLAAGLDVVLMHDLLQCVNEARCAEPLAAGEVETIGASIARTHFTKREAVDEPGQNYPKNSLCTHEGSLWISRSPTGSAPGNPGGSDWKMCVKRGRDGKDGKDWRETAPAKGWGEK